MTEANANNGSMKVALGSDHAGFQLKESIKRLLAHLGYEFHDFGTHSEDACDYPEYAHKVAQAVAGGQFRFGILCCGSGVGVSIAANKVGRARAALCRDVLTATLSRQHNDANILCLGQRFTAAESSHEIVKAWLSTDFAGGRHETRVKKIESCQDSQSP